MGGRGLGRPRSRRSATSLRSPAHAVRRHRPRGHRPGGPVGLEFSGRQQRLDGLLGPGGLLGGRGELVLDLGLGLGDQLGGPGAGVGQGLLRLARIVSASACADSRATRVSLSACSRSSAACASAASRSRRLRASASAVRVSTRSRVSESCWSARARAPATSASASCRASSRTRSASASTDASCSSARRICSARVALGLGDDLVAVVLCGLHEDPRLLTGVGDDLVGVGGAVARARYAPASRARVASACSASASVLSRSARSVAACGLLLGPRDELVGDLLGMAEKRGGVGCADGLGGGSDRTVLHRGHGGILPDDRTSRQPTRQTLADGPRASVDGVQESEGGPREGVRDGVAQGLAGGSSALGAGLADEAISLGCPHALVDHLMGDLLGTGGVGGEGVHLGLLGGGLCVVSTVRLRPTPPDRASDVGRASDRRVLPSGVPQTDGLSPAVRGTTGPSKPGRERP